HNFGERVRQIAEAHAHVRQSVFYSRPSVGDVEGQGYDRAGRIDMAWLTENTPLLEADVFLCGPRAFMRRFAVGLTKAGLPRRQLHTEFFGPVEDLFDDAVDFEQPLATPVMNDAPRIVTHAETGHGFGLEDIGRTLMQSAADAVIASDRAGHIVHWNAGA